MKIRHRPFLEKSVSRWGTAEHCLWLGGGAPQNSGTWQNIMGSGISHGSFLADDSNLRKGCSVGFTQGYHLASLRPSTLGIVVSYGECEGGCTVFQP